MSEQSQFYKQRKTIEAGVTVKKAQVRVAITGGVLRMLALIILSLAVATIAFWADLDLGTGHLLSAVILLIAVSALASSAHSFDLGARGGC